MPGISSSGELTGLYIAPKFALNIQHTGQRPPFRRVSRLRTSRRLRSVFRRSLPNVYWDITEWNGFPPYVGLGAGVAFLKTEGQLTTPRAFSESWHDTDAGFAGQVGLGFSHAFTESVSADFGYRFLMPDEGGRMESPAYSVREGKLRSSGHARPARDLMRLNIEHSFRKAMSYKSGVYTALPCCVRPARKTKSFLPEPV